MQRFQQGLLLDSLHTPTCVVQGCNGHPAFGLPGAPVPTHCKDHALLLLNNWEANHQVSLPPPLPPPKKKGPKGRREPVVKVPASQAPVHRPPKEYKGNDPRRQFRKSAICQVEGCVTLSSYGYPGQKAVRCRAHIEDGMVDIQNRRCQAEACSKQASFGYPGMKKVRCKAHLLSGMVDLVSNMCEGEGCQKHASFGWPSQGATRCKEHMLDGMGDVKNKSCKIEGCKSQSYFGYPGEKATRCRVHREDSMVDVITKRCTSEGCEARATYGWPGERPIVGRLRCKQHAEPGMETMESRKCTTEECSLPARFGYKGKGGPRKCRQHMEPDMVNLRDKQCQAEGCSLHPKFGFPGGARTHCKTHALPGMKCHNWRLGSAGSGVVPTGHALPGSEEVPPPKKKRPRQKVPPKFDLGAAWNNLVADTAPQPLALLSQVGSDIAIEGNLTYSTFSAHDRDNHQQHALLPHGGLLNELTHGT